MGFPGGASGKEPACQRRRCERRGFDPWVRKILQGRAWQPTPVFLPGEPHGQRSLVGYSPWGRKELDTTEVTQHACMQETNSYYLVHMFASPQLSMASGNLVSTGWGQAVCLLLQKRMRDGFLLWVWCSLARLQRLRIWLRRQSVWVRFRLCHLLCDLKKITEISVLVFLSVK